MRLLLVFILIVSSCSDIRKRPEHVLMEKADSLMITHPDSALSILQGMEVPREKASRMRYEMLLTDAINKNNLPLTSDSTMKEVVAYYDRHGTSQRPPACQLPAGTYLSGAGRRSSGFGILSESRIMRRYDTDRLRLSRSCLYSQPSL